MTTLSEKFKFYNTHDADAVAADIRPGKIAYANGGKIVGAMPSRLRHGYRVFDDASTLSKTAVNLTGTAHTVMLSLSGVITNASSRRIFRAQSPSGYSTLSLEVYSTANGNGIAAFQANSVNSALLFGRTDYFTPALTVVDEGTYNVFFSSNRTTGDCLLVINGVVVSDDPAVFTANTTGVHQTGNHTLYFGSIAGSQYLRSAMGNLMFDDQYLTNWQDFMDPDTGDFKQLDTSGWTEWGGGQPLVYAVNGDLNTNNLGSVGAFSWSP